MNPLFSHKSDNWETPNELYDSLNREFGPFVIDVAASFVNRKCSQYYDESSDALNRDWGFRNWCNPPYSRVQEFVIKALAEQKRGRKTVMLIPARTDTKLFHDYLYNKPHIEIRFLKGRVKFINPDGPLLRGTKMNGSNNSAPFASMVVIFHHY